MEKIIMKGTLNKAFWLICICLLCLIIWTDRPVLAGNEKTEILIGVHLPLSGPQAMQAIEQKWAFEKAVEDINKKSGIYVKQYDKKLPVRLVMMDDETDPVKAKIAVEKLINQRKVDFILNGCAGLHGVLQGLITAEKYRKYYHATSVWIPEYLNYDFKWSTLYFFDMVQGGVMPFEIWNSLPENERPKRPAVFMEDTFDGEQLGKLLTAHAEKYGYKIVLQETMALGGKDFTSQIIKAKSMGVDAILLFSNTEETATLVHQMKKVDFSVKFLHGWKGTWASEFYEALGKDADYIFCDGFWSEDYPFPKAKELGESYYKRFGKHSVSIGMYYASCQILWQAVENAGTLDSVKVRQAILNGEFNTVMGKVDYDKRGVAVFPLATYQWWKGKQEIIYPLEYSKFRVRIAPPWNERGEKPKRDYRF